MLANSLKIEKRIILFIYFMGMMSGTFMHVSWVISNGLFNHKSDPIFLNYYWDSLTLLDPLAGLFLFIRPRIGIWMVVAIIVSDVIFNTIYFADELFFSFKGTISVWLFKYWEIVCQWLFCIFVLVTFPQLRQELKNDRASSILV